jgi:membrane protease YdiL (CAAX protease family)
MKTQDKSFNEILLFFLITIGSSFLVFWGPLAIYQIPTINFVEGPVGPIWAILLFIIGGFVPSFTAIFLTGIKEGKTGLNKLWKKATFFRLPLKWYVAVLGIVLLGTVFQIIVILMLEKPFDFKQFYLQSGSFLPLIILGPLSEEIGWRGYALPRLQKKWNALASSVILGFFWSLWHFPLFYMPGTTQNTFNIPFISFMTGLIAISIIYTWIFNNTGQSVWSAIFFHWIFTYALQVVASSVVRTPMYDWIEYLPYVVVSIVIVIKYGPNNFMKKTGQK